MTAILHHALDHHKAGRLEDALRLYCHVLEGDPDNPNALNLGGVLQKLARHDDVIEAYRRILALDANHATARHMLAALTGENTDASPPDYVASLFDDFAPRFEDKLVAALDYRIPERMRETVETIFDGLPEGSRPPFRHALDLGCGSGLVGPLFRDLVDCLYGVDLSEKMIDAARAKGVYDDLAVGEMVSHLATLKPDDLDLVLAADVFVYVGDLAPVFAGIARCIAPGGLFVFSVERLPSGDFLLRPTGRYAQSDPYVRDRAAAAGFEVVRCDDVVVRTENDAPIDGYLYWLRRTAVE